ncbi:MAG: hypothetical protein GEU96_01930 [Propionibacteriales bacterium]|nr:hypothetical protein [Propionibacteriales bacterium]
MTSYVQVPVATLWTRPDAPRALDLAAVAEQPDIDAWLARLDAEPDHAGRLGLHGLVVTQLLAGEPAEVVSERDGWTEVVAPWQPSRLDRRGYPGWLPIAHLTGTPQAGSDWARLQAAAPPYSPLAVLDAARPFVGSQYLWAGTCDAGVDCSGLVHLVSRRFGLRVPRDAHDQRDAATPVPLGDEQPGDLYFFARPGKTVHHVGYVVEPGVMLHASETGRVVAEEELTADRRDLLVAVGRFAPA